MNIRFMPISTDLRNSYMYRLTFILVYFSFSNLFLLILLLIKFPFLPIYCGCDLFEAFEAFKDRHQWSAAISGKGRYLCI